MAIFVLFDYFPYCSPIVLGAQNKTQKFVKYYAAKQTLCNVETTVILYHTQQNLSCLHFENYQNFNAETYVHYESSSNLQCTDQYFGPSPISRYERQGSLPPRWTTRCSSHRRHQKNEWVISSAALSWLSWLSGRSAQHWCPTKQVTQR